MHTAQDYLADAWRLSVGLPSKILPPLEQLKDSQWCSEFEQAMRNRLIMGSFRYGLMEEQDFRRYDFAKDIERRLGLFEKDHSLEHLVDSANLLMLMFIQAKREGYTLSAKDDAEHTKLKDL